MCFSVDLAIQSSEECSTTAKVDQSKWERSPRPESIKENEQLSWFENGKDFRRQNTQKKPFRLPFTRPGHHFFDGFPTWIISSGRCPLKASLSPST
jgi:hypothetical protein